MTLAANLNGYIVVTDKQLVSLRGTTVHFDDGSFYDAATDERHNGGLHTMHISKPATKPTNDVAIVEAYFAATSLSLETVDARVTVRPSLAPYCRVVMSGPAERIADYHCYMQRERLTIAGYLSQRLKAVDITIDVPLGTTIEIQHGKGSFDIGHVNGQLDVDLNRQQVVTARQISGLRALMDDSATLLVASCSGTVYAQVRERATLEILDGVMANQTISAYAQAVVTLLGTTTTGSYHADGKAHITVARILERPVSIVETYPASITIKERTWRHTS